MFHIFWTGLDQPATSKSLYKKIKFYSQNHIKLREKRENYDPYVENDREC